MDQEGDWRSNSKPIYLSLRLLGGLEIVKILQPRCWLKSKGNNGKNFIWECSGNTMHPIKSNMIDGLSLDKQASKRTPVDRCLQISCCKSQKWEERMKME